LKNLVFFSVNNKEGKKIVIKKLTYNTLLNLLDDPELTIQEQALLIFRFLLYKTAEDIEEVIINLN
jgi:hypothetical protein